MLVACMLAPMRPARSTLVLASFTVVLCAIAWLGVRNYGNNVSALFHMDVPFGERNDVPEGLVLYEDAAYDGMLYYQVARDVPKLVDGRPIILDSPYRFQRILLPLLVNAVTFGDAAWFPWAFLLLNVGAAVLALALTMRLTKTAGVHALTAVANPAVFVGMLYSLTEPLSLLFVVVFLGVWERAKKTMDAWGVLALTLSVFARETTVFLMGLLVLWYLWKRKWKDAALAFVPAIPFLAWQRFLAFRFGEVGFQANSNVIDFPFSGPIQLLGMFGDGKLSYRLSAFALLLFLLPLCAVLAREWLRLRVRIDAYAFLLAGLCATMLCMDAHMWGAITSIGRVVTPVYPVYAVYAAHRDTKALRGLSWLLIAISLVAAVGIASVPHPYVVS